MFSSRGESWADPHNIIALVELDLQKMRVRIVLAREAIRGRLKELEHAKGHHGQMQRTEDARGHGGLGI
jgi:hypothetical protein